MIGILLFGNGRPHTLEERWKEEPSGRPASPLGVEREESSGFPAGRMTEIFFRATGVDVRDIFK
jgi:hypothetical protein